MCMTSLKQINSNLKEKTLTNTRETKSLVPQRENTGNNKVSISVKEFLLATEFSLSLIITHRVLYDRFFFPFY